MTDFIEPSAFSIHCGILLMAFLLDIAIGDPKWLPHPVRIMGKAIAKTETLLRKSEVSSQKSKVKLKGIFLVFIIVGLTFGLTTLIVYFLIRLKDLSFLFFFLSSAFMIYLTATTIAVHELIKSARIVIESIKNNDLDSAKKNLSMIVGRDTQNLSEKGILKAVIETISENLSDGIIAPLFYLAIGGLPLAMTYKAINTLDSMVGYKNERYKDFGWAAARLDDIANYIPARISGVLISVASLVVCRSLSNSYYSLKTMVKDGKKHLSPNAGMPEAAIAGALGVQLGGPSTYSGMVIQKPYIGIERTEDYLTASEKAIKIIKVASTVGVITIGVYLYAK